MKPKHIGLLIIFFGLMLWLLLMLARQSNAAGWALVVIGALVFWGLDAAEHYKQKH
jgi:predicted membrane metal-binding protein